MAYGVGQVQQVPILSPQEHQQIAQENQARQLTLQAAVEKRRADIAQAQAKAQQDQFLQESVQKHMVDGRPDFDAVIRDAYSAYPDLAMSLEEQLSKHRSSLVDARKKELETEKLHMDLDLEAMKRMVDPNTFAAYRGRLSPEAQQAVGEQFDPERLALLMNKAPTETQRLDRLRILLDKDTRRAMLEELNSAAPDDIEHVWAGWSELFGPKDTAAIRQRIGDVSTPEGKARLKQLLTTPDNPLDAARFEETKRSNAASEKLRARDIAVAEGNLQVRRQEANKPPAAGKTGPDVAAILTEIDGLSQKINTGAGGPEALLSGYLRRGQSKAQLDNDVSQYEALISGMIPMVARAVGHTGVLTQQDVDSVRAMFPKVTDNKELAQRKMATIKKLIGGNTGGGSVRDDEPSDLVYDPKTKSFRKGGK